MTIQNNILHQLCLIHVQDGACGGSPRFQETHQWLCAQRACCTWGEQQQQQRTAHYSLWTMEWNILPTEHKVTNSWLQRNYHGIYLGILEMFPTKPLIQSSVEFCNEYTLSMSQAWRQNLAVEFNQGDKGNYRSGQSRLSKSKKSKKKYSPSWRLLSSSLIVTLTETELCQRKCRTT